MGREWTGKNATALTVVFLAYVAAGKIGLGLAFVNPSASPIWAPTGIAMASIAILGPGAWRVVYVAAFLVNVTTTGSIAASLAIAAGNTLEGVAGAWALTRFSSGVHAFRTPRGIMDFGLFVAFLCTMISATIGATALSMGGLAPWTAFPSIWTTWWLGDATGALIVTPLICLWATEPPVTWQWRPALEGAVIALLVVTTVAIVFGGRFPSDVKTYPLEFLCGPLLMWTAFRFGPTAVATAIALIAGTAVWGTTRGYGPFIRATPNESLLLLQTYMSVTALVFLSLAAAVQAQLESERRLRELSGVDPLTGLANYRRLLETIASEISRAERTGRSFVVLFLDVNGLKRINDTRGHLAGIEALCRVADVLRLQSRATDTPARFGGDEFAVVMPESGADGAASLSERIREMLASSGGPPVVSVAIGFAEYPRDGIVAEALLATADHRLYSARPSNYEGM